MTNVELPINKYLDRYKDMVEIGLKPETGTYDIHTQTINTDSWAGRNINFMITNASLNRLVLGHRCFLNFTCRATLANGDPITLDNTNVELRDGVGNLLVENIDATLAGTPIHTDSTVAVTRHFYEHLVNSNAKRDTGMYEDRFITDERLVFGSAPGTMIRNGIRVRAIANNRRFNIIRPITEVTFFGPNDSAIPSSLPFTFNIRLNSRPGRVFNAGLDIVEEPRLFTEKVELYVFSIEMEDVLAASLNERLRSNELMAVSDHWGSRNSGVSIQSTSSSTSSQSDVILETTPDFLGITFFPNISFSPAGQSHGGFHPMNTSWLNINTMVIKAGGYPIRYYKEMGLIGEVGRKTPLSNEIKSINTEECSPISQEIYTGGSLSFFPLVIRPIDDMYVLPPRPFSISFEAQMPPGAGLDAGCFYIYKMRHQWMLSSQMAQTKIVK